MATFVLLLPLWFALAGALANSVIIGARRHATASAMTGMAGVVQLVVTVLAIVTLLTWSPARRPEVAADFGPMTAVWVAIGIAAGAACIGIELGVAWAMDAGRRLIPAVVRDGATASLLTVRLSGPGWWVIGISLAVTEEVLWRGVAHETLRTAGWGSTPAMVVLAVLFGVNHAWFGMRSVIAKSLEGLFWGTIVLASGTVLAAIAAHVCFQCLVLHRLSMQQRSTRRAPWS